MKGRVRDRERNREEEKEKRKRGRNILWEKRKIHKKILRS